jgi:hypothetical protein
MSFPRTDDFYAGATFDFAFTLEKNRVPYSADPFDITADGKNGGFKVDFTVTKLPTLGGVSLTFGPTDAWPQGDLLVTVTLARDGAKAESEKFVVPVKR